jgi:hypothetical protein
MDLTVAYHEPRPSASALSRLLDWLDPAAYAKGASGLTRMALWLGDGLLAVTGTDEESFTDARGRIGRRPPTQSSRVWTRPQSLWGVPCSGGDPGREERHRLGLAL